MIKKIKTTKIRVRFAPSPTGQLHIGNSRTALFNYLFAKKNKGAFILRIEDTDKERSELKWVQEIIEELKWLGIEWSEGPDIGGAFGPYKQSQRLDIYKEYLEKLLSEKKAYYCNCSAEELEAKRQDQTSRGLAPKYDGKCRDKNNTAGVIRFKITNKKIKFHDLVRTDVEFDMGLLGDIVIAKNLETPLFHFTVVVDDFLMQISHVIRGEDHIANTPRQILLQEALGFTTPIYAHIPLLLNPDKSKLSKRQGDVALKDYHDKGYLPEALINFMVLLGWNPGTEKEIFTLQELVKEFSLEKVQKSGAVFNVQKLDHINNHYIKEKSDSALLKLCESYLPKGSEKFPKKTLEKIIEVHKPRMKKLSDITELADFLFAEKLTYDKNLLAWAKMESGEVRQSLEHSANILSSAKKWDEKSLETLLVKEAEKFNAKNRGYLLWPLRVALSGKKASASPFEIASILGKEKTLQRIQEAIDKL
ncbi:MAG: glutamate--tRNA ligase [Candidatus Staskawiczbacteria bacterium RIFCSPHIGHO2_12_FULL_38_11]|uniref:Glutamate--tRNA ligase n=1 Tax=Candidatus Staskawiczbacteria bacterium RIFCSPHIGHO2_12_FULL_38_11 TaxID=1802209 RepID=A0A1G2I4S1_9BACT|nr:MAG: glutamate--tRNA ligase [Candidatus Staskawiczbacteria bacterium RIFCSPHIGHO2_12_FULL_38_11]